MTGPATITRVLDDRRLVVIGIGLALLPLAVSAMTLVVGVGSDWRPSADHALIELRATDVGRHPVLIGLYSREGWNHPGPALFYVLAVPYRLTGGASIGLALGALAVNGAALAGMVLVARRLGGTPLALVTLVALGLLASGLGPDFLRDPWTPFVTVLPFALLIFLVWAMACGVAWALPVAAGVATFCVQTHIAYGPFVVPLVIAGAVWLVVGARSRPDRRRMVRAVVVAGGVLAVLWTPTIIDQATGDPGNVTELIRYFRSDDRELHTLVEGWRVVTGQFGLPPEWVAGARPINPVTGEHRFLRSAPEPLLLLALPAAAVVLWRRRDGVGGRLLAVVALVLALGVVTVSRVPGLVYTYLVRWTWAAAMAAAVAVAWFAWREVARRSARVEARWLRPAALAALVILTSVNVVAAARAGTPQEPQSTALRSLTSDVVEALPDGDGTVVVRAASFTELLYTAGLLLGLERSGVDARTDQFEARVVGEHRVRGDGPVRATLRVAGREAAEGLAEDPGQRLVASWSRFSEDELARRRDEARSLDAAHERGELNDAEWVVERNTVLPGDSTVAVFLSGG